MEAREETTARLVLGYLRSVGCSKAYNEFLKSSVHLLHYTDDNVKSKYIPTRYNGLSLDNILKDYFECSQTVQGRLEVTNYFNEVHTDVSLEKQLSYLLNRAESKRSSTPVANVVLESSDSDGDSCVEVCNNPEGKPGGSISDVSDSVPNSESKNRAANADPLAGSSSMGVVIDTEIFRDTLLNNSELQAKMAETINNTLLQVDTQQFDLNETIRSVVVQTEKDPVFKQIMDEIMDSVVNLQDNNGISGDSEESFSEKCCHHKRPKQGKKLSPGQHAETQTENAHPMGERTNCSSNVSKYVVANTIPPPSQLYLDPMGNLVVLPPPIPATGIAYPPSQYYLVNKKTDDCTAGTLPLSTVIPNGDTICKTKLPPSNAITPASGQLKQQTATTDKSKSKLPLEICSPSVRNKCATPSAVKEFLNKSAKTNTYLSTSTPKSSVDAKPKAAAKMDKLKNMCNFVNKNKTEHGLEHVIVLQPEPIELETIPGGIETHTNATKQVIDKSKRSDPTNVNNSNTRDMPAQEVKKLPLLAPKPSGPSMIKSDDDHSRRKTLFITPLQRNSLKKATPKSTSHVRNLDFSTPHKIPATQTILENKSKMQATKSLFKPEKTSVKRPWDADLRVCLEPLDKQMISTKKKRKFADDHESKKSKVVKKENQCKSKVDPPSQEENVPINQKENEELIEMKDDALNKIILSPSKYSANKRALMGESNQATAPQTTEQENVPCNKPSFAVVTPVKGFIKTPGATTPAEATPFTKMLEANIKTMNINNITTPSIPFTPDFPPMTPDLLSPYQNRPTDYSTGSSYYQPSDNEITKSLEKLMTKMEKHPQPKVPNLHEDMNNFLQLSSDSEVEEVEMRCKLCNCRTGSNVQREKTQQGESGALCKCKPAPPEKRTTRQSVRQGIAKEEDKNQDKNVKTPATKKKSNQKTKQNTSSSKKKTPKKPIGSKTDAAQSGITTESDGAISKLSSSQIKPTKEEMLLISDTKGSKGKKSRCTSKAKVKESNSRPHLFEAKPMQRAKIGTLDKKEHERLEIKTVIKAQKNNQAEIHTAEPISSKIESSIPAEKKSEEEKMDAIPMENRSFIRRAEIFPTTNNMEKNWFLKLFSEDLNLSQSTSQANEDENAQIGKDNEGNKCLIPWLEQRGIYLVENKAKKEHELKGKINISDLSKEITYSTRHTLDTQTFDEPDACLVFDETTKDIEGEKPTKPFQKFTVSWAKIYMEELDADVEITLIHSHVYSLIEIPAGGFMEADSPQDCLDNEDDNNGNDNNYDDDMSLEEETINGLNTYERIKDRSTQAKSLLQGINLDTFLDNIHGNSSSEC